MENIKEEIVESKEVLESTGGDNGKIVENGQTEDFLVTPFEVKAGAKGVDYEKLITIFGCSRLTLDIVERFEKLTGKKAHHFLRRGIFYSHREFNKILDCVEQKKPFYLYTGRGPSNTSLHLGHTIPFIFTKYLQEVFDCPLVIQITDDEKFIYKKELKLEETILMGKENIKDIIAFGFNPKKTFIFSDCDYIQYLYKNTLKIQKAITFSQLRNMFGIVDSDNIGKIAFPAVQCAPCFPDCFPHIFGTRKDIQCLIPAAIDQDPYFRMTRDICVKLGYIKTSTLYAKFFPALEGLTAKMSSSESCILLSDTAKQIIKKINKYAFSGGKATEEEHRKFGGDIEVDIPYKYLEFFQQDDDLLKIVADKYTSGEMLSGEIKKELANTLIPWIEEYQNNRKKVTDEMITEFTSIREMSCDVGLYSFI